MPIPFDFDFRNPDYTKVFMFRMERLAEIRKNPKVLPSLKSFYRDNPAQFIIDWGCTADPRNADIGLPPVIPFLLYQKQEDWVEWCVERWKSRTPGISDKSRDMGLSWLSIGFACTLCLFYDDLSLGFGSRKEDYVDLRGSPKSIFYKARQFMNNIPVEFKGDWDENRHAPHMRVSFPSTNSIISGEAGDGIGRGDRAAIYFVDESAHIPRPNLVDASLSMTTNCRIDISTPRGMNNPFARKRFSGNISVFSLHWRDDPRKDQDWYLQQCKNLDYDSVVIAQEIDLDYSASMAGVVIPSAWIQAAIDAHVVLKIDPKGIRRGGLDVSAEGADLNAFCGRYGILLEYLDQWTGKNSDTFATVEKAFSICGLLDYSEFLYDADGLGALVKGDARVINEKRDENKIKVMAFHGSGAVVDPEGYPYGRSGEIKDDRKNKGRTNEDYFANAKAQAWFSLRTRFQRTYRWVMEGIESNPDDIISISSGTPFLTKMIIELSQPTFAENNTGKMIINKVPDGSKSPNLADAVMMAYAPIKKPYGGMFSV